MGRFVSADTIVPGAGNSQAYNRYAYGLSNPLRFFDPSGHFSESQVEDYLKKNYEDKWESYLAAWRADKIFWEMLMKANFMDRLETPSDSELGPGVFTYEDTTFGFNHKNKTLRDFQGRGPYSLNGDLPPELLLKASEMFLKAPHLKEWSQPQYDYASGEPVFTGKHRNVWYATKRTEWDLFAGTNTPFLLNLIALFKPKFTLVTFPIDMMTYLDNRDIYYYGLVVSYSTTPGRPPAVYDGPPIPLCYTSVVCGK